MNDYPNWPPIGVGAVVIRHARVLLVRRAKAPRAGRWSLPGGRQRLGETVREAAAREVREETGVEVEVTALLDVVDFLADVTGTASVIDGDTIEVHGHLSLQCHFVRPSRHCTAWWIRQAEM